MELFGSRTTNMDLSEFKRRLQTLGLEDPKWATRTEMNRQKRLSAPKVGGTLTVESLSSFADAWSLEF